MKKVRWLLVGLLIIVFCTNNQVFSQEEKDLVNEVVAVEESDGEAFTEMPKA
ncbi:hypothetical protein [Candidatus Enterococcus ferrettii]|uniref:Uncharacterized protein n=1 Tax=Candidatus Enterococcus ferrettii TaxID=2815324 RepID=A0ABV0EW88_9ENTE|nr:hypothetical protein [Enterococcus sp. 665A]MBO1342263.1 hypothetical protein [Enterococcus sp. 665A]